MGLETVTYVPELNQSNPIGASDPKSEGDDHLRNIKKALLNTFGAFVGTAGAPKSVTLTEDQINDASQKLAAETIAGDKTHSGFVRTDDSTTTRAGFRIPTGVAPTSPAQGDIWTEAADLKARINGVTHSMIGASSIITKFKTANQTYASDTTFNLDTHLTIAGLDADSVYAFWGFLDCQSNVTADMKFQMDYTDVPQDGSQSIALVTTGGAFLGDGSQSATGVIDVFWIGIVCVGIIHGVFKTNATTGGTATLSHAQRTSDVGTTGLRENSWMAFQKL